MALFQKQGNEISKFLEDLTHLEINTIIKDGMLSTPPPSTLNEIVFAIFSLYKEKLILILTWQKYQNIAINNTTDSFKKLHNILSDLTQDFTQKNIRLDTKDYILFLRIVSFCDYLKSTKNLILFNDTPLYDLSVSELLNKSSEITAPIKDRVKLHRIYDLGVEHVVMQTRFSLDGDVVTRIEKDFAASPQNTIIEIHNKQINLSVNYWKSLIGLAKNLISELFNGSK